jgi:hypothetical protein
VTIGKELDVVRWLSFAVLVLSLALPSRPAQAQYGGMGGMGRMPGGGGGMMMMGPMPAPPKPEKMKPYGVKVESGGGSVAGTLRLASVVLYSDLGQYDIKPEKVREIRFLPRQPDQPGVQFGHLSAPVPGVVVTRTGEELKGNIVVQQWQLENDLGTITLNPTSLKLVSFTAQGEKTEKEKSKEKPKEKPKEKEKVQKPGKPGPVQSGGNQPSKGPRTSK